LFQSHNNHDDFDTISLSNHHDNHDETTTKSLHDTPFANEYLSKSQFHRIGSKLSRRFTNDSRTAALREQHTRICCAAVCQTRTKQRKQQQSRQETTSLEIKSTNQDLCRLWTTLYVAQEVGTKLGRGVLLFETMQRGTTKQHHHPRAVATQCSAALVSSLDPSQSYKRSPFRAILHVWQGEPQTRHIHVARRGCDETPFRGQLHILLISDYSFL
jgi:hypothetical protein